MTRKSVKRQRYMPYAFVDDGLQLSVETLDLHAAGEWYGTSDDSAEGERVGRMVVENQRRVRLDYDAEWETVELGFQVRWDEGLLARVLDPSECADPPIAVVVAVHCRATMVRDGVHLALPAGPTATSASGQLTIPRHHVASSLTLTPWMVRTRAGDSAHVRTANVRGAKLASGPPWEVRVDAPAPAQSQHLDVRYRSFSRSSIELLEEFHDNVFMLESEGEQPILWLNEDHPKIAEVLNSEGTVGVSARLREVFFDSIAGSVWLQLLLQALGDLTEELEARHPWQESVLDSLLPEVFPEVDPELLREHARQVVEEEGLPWLMSRAIMVLQRRQSMGNHMRRAIEEALER